MTLAREQKFSLFHRHNTQKIQKILGISGICQKAIKFQRDVKVEQLNVCRKVAEIKVNINDKFSDSPSPKGTAN